MTASSRADSIFGQMMSRKLPSHSRGTPKVLSDGKCQPYRGKRFILTCHIPTAYLGTTHTAIHTTSATAATGTLHSLIKLDKQLCATMGSAKKEANRKVRQGKVGDGMNNIKTKGENFYRSVKSIYHLVPACRLIILLQDGEEGEDAEYVQGWSGATKRCGKDHQSRRLSVSRDPQGASGTQPQMVHELSSHLAECAPVVSRGHCCASLRPVSGSVENQQIAHEFGAGRPGHEWVETASGQDCGRVGSV